MDVNTFLQSLEEVVGEGFARYSKYIIQDRAIPDARDGLKPVQRRILYAMYKEGNTNNKPYRKSAKSVGVIIGNYHPHGDSSVYDALVRLSQDFKMNYPLIDMHGNNGSVDGDPPAAMRYTEARLSPISMKLLANVNKNTVEFAPNFDDTELEPTVLPAYYPNLLVNGSTGISAGYATDIPSHNLAEVIDACIYRLENPLCELKDLLKIIKGPDFSTGGIIQGKDAIKTAYETGKGRIVLRSKIKIEETKTSKIINVLEIPYEVNKADLVRKLEEIRYDKILDGFIAVRDESDRKGLSIVIELKKEANDKLILNYLYKNTNLQVYYNFNMVAIVNKTPQLLGLIPLLDAYINHQKDVLINMSKYELDLSKKKIHIIEGLIKAVDIIDEIIKTIRQSKNRSESINNLVASFSFTLEQATAIVDLRLHRLSNTDVDELKTEQAKLIEYIDHLKAILSDEQILKQEIINNLIAVKKEFSQKRKTKIEKDIEDISIEKEQLIPDMEVMISVSRDGYLKRSSLRSYQSSNFEIVKKDDDFIFVISKATTLNKLLLFFEDGKYACIPVYDILETKWKDFGKHVNNYVKVSNSRVVNALLVDEFNHNNIVSITNSGQIKVSALKDFEVTRYNRTYNYMSVKSSDKVSAVFASGLNQDVALITKQGFGLRFPLKEIALTSLKTKGAKGINLGKDDEVVTGLSIAPNNKQQLFLILESGQTKRILTSNLTRGRKGTKGLLLVKQTKTNPRTISNAYIISESFEIFYVKQDNQVGIIETKNTPLSTLADGLRKDIKLSKQEMIIDSCLIKDVLIEKIDEEEIIDDELQLSLFEDKK